MQQGQDGGRDIQDRGAPEHAAVAEQDAAGFGGNRSAVIAAPFAGVQLDDSGRNTAQRSLPGSAISIAEAELKVGGLGGVRPMVDTSRLAHFFDGMLAGVGIARS